MDIKQAEIIYTAQRAAAEPGRFKPWDELSPRVQGLWAETFAIGDNGKPQSREDCIKLAELIRREVKYLNSMLDAGLQSLQSAKTKQ